MQRNFSTGISKEAAASVSPNSKALKKQSRVSGTDAIRGLHHTLSGNTNGLISLLLGAFGGLMGLIGLFLGPFTLLCGLFSIAGIIFGIAGLKKDEKKTMATIGLVWNSINFILGTISLIAWIAIILMY